MTAGRQFHTQQTHYIAAELEATDFASSGATKVIGVIPAGSVIKGYTLNINTAFNLTTLPAFSVGDGFATQRFFAPSGADLTSANLFTTGTTGGGTATVDLSITAKLKAGGNGTFPTAGKLQYILEYFPPNDNKQDRATFN